MRRAIALLPIVCIAAGCGSSHQPAAAILFTRGEASILLVRLDGSGLQPYLVHASQPAVSPDGRRVAFVRRGEVWMLSRHGRAPHAITKAMRGWGDAAEPS